jgi:ABC-type transporter Mla maintaining outer membrane lipid asymmetry ATPase subunit MlaF
MNKLNKNRLELINVGITFDNSVLFDNVNLSVKKNEIIIIKTGVLDGGTSLLKLCNATLAPQLGKVLFSDKTSDKLTPLQLFKTVGMQFETGGLLSMFTVSENCMLALNFHTRTPKATIINQINTVADEFNLSYLLDKYPYQLNDVQARLANLLRLLVSSPKILLLDEIQSGMSEDLKNSLIDKLINFIKNHNSSMIMTVTAGAQDDFADTRFEIHNKNLLRY